MFGEYSKELRAESAIYFVVGSFFYSIFTSGIIAFSYLPKSLTASPSNKNGILIAHIFVSALIAWVSYILLRRDRLLASVTLLVSGHILMLVLLSSIFWHHGNLLMYFAAVYIVAGGLILPQGGLLVWGGWTLGITAVIFLSPHLLLTRNNHTIAAIGFNFFIGLSVLALTGEWQVALEWATRSRLSARKRRDELYNVQEQLQRANDKRRFLYAQLSASFAIAHQITSILELDALLHEVVQVIASQFNYGYVAIFLSEKEPLQLRLHAETGAGATGTEEILLFNEGQTIGKTAVSRELLHVQDLRQQEYTPHAYSWKNARSELTLPLIVGDKLVGVLDIQNTTAVFDEDSISMLSALAAQVSISIQNAILYQREEARRQLSDRLFEIGHALSSTLDRDKTLQLILENLSELVAYDRGSILLEQDEQAELTFVAAKGFPEGLEPLDLRIPLHADSDDVFWIIHNSKRPLAISDINEYVNWYQADSTLITGSWMGVPLVRKGRVIGMLSLAREQVQPYSNREITLANTFATQAAVALQNAHLYSQLDRFNRELEDMVKKRTIALSQSNAQLQHMDRAKSEFIGVASHELRTPLTILLGYSDILLYDKTIQMDERLHKLVSGIHDGSMRMHGIINDMLDMAKIDDDNLKIYIENTYLRVVLDSVVSTFENVLVERNLRVKVEIPVTLPTIEADSTLLEKAFAQLFINAIKYTPDGGEISILAEERSSTDNDPDGTLITLRDTGIGIDPAYHELIFNKFYQTGEVTIHSSGKTKFKGGGPGLGLSIAQGIIVGHNGRIWVESVGHDEEIYPGSQFFVFLPLRQPVNL